MNAHLVVVPHTHWDREWYKTFQQFRKKLVTLLDGLLDIMEHDPDYKCFNLDGQTIILDDYLEIRSANHGRLKALIQAGRLQIGPWYVLPDEFLVSGEALIRNLLIGHRDARQFGASMKVGYTPDQFGHISQMPQILVGFGLEDTVVWRGVGDDVNATEFLWESPDGSRVFTVYLATSYSNGAGLPTTVPELRRRLETIVENLRPYSRTDTFLVMNGDDHQPPQREIPGLMERVTRQMPGVSFEMGSLPTYVARAKAGSEDLPVHRGELRSSGRAHMLVGVTSARARIKQRDFENCRLLEKYVEPLSTWVHLLGGQDNRDFIDYLWRLILQNHPHDSICGCSIDQVHREMETRFDQVAQLGEVVLDEALSFFANQLGASAFPDGTDLLVLYNPNPAAESVAVDAAVELAHEGEVCLRDSEGRRIATQVMPGERSTIFRAELSADQFKQTLAGLRREPIQGFFINGFSIENVAKALKINVIMGSRPVGGLDFELEKARVRELLEEMQPLSVNVVAFSVGTANLSFIAPRVPGYGFAAYAIEASQSPLPQTGLRHSAEGIGNQFYRVQVSPDGTLDIDDLELGVRFPNCNNFVDLGDRGDEYNFDPVPDDVPIDLVSPSRQDPAAPALISKEVVETGPVRVTMRLEFKLDIPERLEDGRGSRTASKVELPITTFVTLYDGVRRIDFRTLIDNRAEDHRLRVHFTAPLVTDVVHMESQFDVVERSLELPREGRYVEIPTGTAPQKTFSSVDDGKIGMSLFNRGVPEIEAVSQEGRTELALTLIRAVGWLARGDLSVRPIAGQAGPTYPTPDAQVQGPHCFEYALTTHRGSYLDAGIVPQAHHYAYPAVAMRARAGAGSFDLKEGIIELDNDSILVSAITPSEEDGCFIVRLYNSSKETQVARLTLWRRDGSVQVVNFLEEPVDSNIRSEKDGRFSLSFRPAQIINLKVDARVEGLGSV